MSKFFRFLSFRGGKPPGSTKSNLCSLKDHTIMSSHSKLRDGCDDLKESIEIYNQRCREVKEMKAKDELYRLEEEKMYTNGSNQEKMNPSSINSKFLSFKSKNKVKTTSSKTRVTKNGQIIPKDSIECVVVFLDQTEEHFFIPKKNLAEKLYEQVFYHLDLIETDYFGLQFSDTHNVQHWLDPLKLIKKQCKIGPPYQFFFKVKFYTVEPNNLKEELTRYFYFLQLKNDLRSGRLQCQQDSIAVELCALILQEELGDFEPQNHTIDTISEFRFLSENQQTEEFEDLVLHKYSSTTYKAMSPAESELTFLNKAKWLEMYGVDMHCVYGRDGNEYKLGLTPSGILVFEEEPIPNSPHFNNNKIGLFFWPKIEKVTFSKKKFTILVGEDDNRGFKQEHTFIFNLIDEKACKHLWKCAVEYHAFFRLKASLTNSNSFGVNGNNEGNLFNGFIRRGSRFRGPQRTEYQTHNLTRLTTPRRSVQFERRPSQRFSRRATYATKRQKHHEQKEKINKEDSNNKPGLVNMKEDLVIMEKNENLKLSVIPPQPLPRASKQSNNKNKDGPLVSCLNESKSEQVNNKKPIESIKHVSSSIGHCCKKQIASNGGPEHDQKCNLFKAKQMELKQKEEAVALTSPKNMLSDSCNKEPCASSSLAKSDISTKNPKNDLNSNLLTTSSSKEKCDDKNVCKLVEKANIFESLELINSNDNNNKNEKISIICNNDNQHKNTADVSQSSTTDQPLINLNVSNQESIEVKNKPANNKRNSLNLDIQNILEPSLAIRFPDLKMTEI